MPDVRAFRSHIPAAVGRKRSGLILESQRIRRTFVVSRNPISMPPDISARWATPWESLYLSVKLSCHCSWGRPRPSSASRPARYTSTPLALSLHPFLRATGSEPPSCQDSSKLRSHIVNPSFLAHQKNVGILIVIVLKSGTMASSSDRSFCCARCRKDSRRKRTHGYGSLSSYVSVR